MPLIVFVLLLSILFSGLTLWVLIPKLRRRLLDQPNARSSHNRPTPRGGGLAFVLVAVIASTLALLTGGFVGADSGGKILLIMPLAIIGFIDDRYQLGVFVRFGVQLATGLLIVCVSPLFTALITALSEAAPFGRLLLFPLFAVSLIAITAVINFTNFMDGLDGLVAGCMAVAMSAAAIQFVAPWPIWALVGSLLGFLFWNWSPAKVFMGDVGSTFLGAVFSLLVLQASSWPEAFALLLVATPLLGDACLCVPRRLMAGQQVFQAHRLHLFQRLHQAGWPHARVSTFYISATALLAIAFLLGGLTWVIPLAVIELLIGVWLDQQVAVPFASASSD